MKKSLLTLIIAFAAYFSANAQFTQIENGSFEDGLNKTATGWYHVSGDVNRVSFVTFKTTNGDSVTVLASDSTYFMYVRTKDTVNQNGDTLADIGRVFTRVATNGRADSIKFDAIYLAAGQQDRFNILMLFTKGRTTGGNDTLGTINLNSAAGQSIYPWTTFSAALPDSITTGADSVSIYLSSASGVQPSYGIGASLLIDNIRMKVTPIPTAIEEQAKSAINPMLNNYPNPFSAYTNIRYRLTEASNVRLTVSDITGREVNTLVNNMQPKGDYQVRFNKGELTSGIYFYTLTAGSEVRTGKMIIE